MTEASSCKMKPSGSEARDGGFGASSATNSASAETSNDSLWITWRPRALLPVDVSQYSTTGNSTTAWGPWLKVHTHWESWKTYRWLCCTYRHFDLCQYSNFLQKAYLFSGEPRGGVYEWQYAHHIILGPSDGFPNVTFSFCETVNSGGQGMPEKSSPDFSSLPSLCSVFMAPVTGILLQQFVSSALLLRLCIIYDLDSKMLVNCSTRNNGMWQQWIPHSWPKYLSVVYKSFQSTIATLLKLLLRMNSDKTREFG